MLRFDKFILTELDSNASVFNEINENNYKKIINVWLLKLFNYKNVYCGVDWWNITINTLVLTSIYRTCVRITENFIYDKLFCVKFLILVKFLTIILYTTK